MSASGGLITATLGTFATADNDHTYTINVNGPITSTVSTSGQSTTYTLSHATQTSYSAKGSATKVPQITTDAYGHVTTITEVTISNTDSKVKQSTTTISEFRPILSAYAATPTSGTSEEAAYNQNIAINTTTNTIKVNACQMTYDTTEQCMKFIFS